jgi:hypothetical protein
MPSYWGSFSVELERVSNTEEALGSPLYSIGMLIQPQYYPETCDGTGILLSWTEDNGFSNPFKVQKQGHMLGVLTLLLD